MSNFTRIAIRKLNELIGQDDFVDILGVSDDGIELRFDSKECTIDKDGRVTWNH